MIGVSRYVVAASLFSGFAAALGLGATPSSAHAQTTASVLITAPNVPVAAKLERTPKVLTGTLFNTHEQRERLDRARQRGGVLEDETAVVDVAAKESARSVINGFVKRSDGRDTVWVDDVMKRDPRSEVMEQLEPNVVGNAARDGVRLVASAPMPTTIGASRISANRVGARRTVSHTRKTRPLKIPKLK